jgi:hypothetical protein
VDFNLPALSAYIVYHIRDEIRIAAARGRVKYAVFTKIVAKNKRLSERRRKSSKNHLFN